MDLYRINLNLLVALDVLLKDEHVSIAAERLHLSQSAMSNNLKQLRLIFNDPLLVRGPEGMLMTPFAQMLKPQLIEVLEDIQQVVKLTPRFDPKTANRVFSIGVSEALFEALFPKVIKFLSKEAPNIQIHWLSRLFVGDLDSLEKGEYELGVGWIAPGLQRDEKVSIKTLWQEFPKCMMSKNHPLAKNQTITIEEYVQYEHVRLFCSEGQTPSSIYNAVEELGRTRTIRFDADSIHLLRNLIRSSNELLGTDFKFCLPKASTHDLVLKDLPFQVEPAEFIVCWHRRQTHDLGLMWLRDSLFNLLLDIDEVVLPKHFSSDSLDPIE